MFAPILDLTRMDDVDEFAHNVAINTSSTLNPKERLGNHVAIVQGITVHDTDVLEPEPARKGGLVRSDTVRIFGSYTIRLACLNRFSNTLSALQPNLFRHQPHGGPSSASTSSLKRRDRQQKLLSLTVGIEKSDVQIAMSPHSKVCDINYLHRVMH